MSYRVFETEEFLRDLDAFYRYLAEYDEGYAYEQFVRLRRILGVEIAGAPQTWATFFATRLIALTCSNSVVARASGSCIRSMRPRAA